MAEKLIPRVVKEIIKKHPVYNQEFPEREKYPIGTEGIYTDMFSGLNLEEELRIGGSKQTEIEYGEDYTLISDKYYLSSDSNKSYYKLTTRIDNKVNRFLVDSNDFLVSKDNDENPFLVFTEEAKDLESSSIIITLWSGLIYGEGIDPIETALRSKIITFSRENNKIKITEQLSEGDYTR